MKDILVYHDEGVSKKFLPFLVKEFEPSVHFIDREKLREEKWLETTDVFLMPGGRDQYYQKKLKGKGDDLIREFVNNGGTYLGICAGAYYAADSIEFAKNTAHEIIEERDLKLIDAKAVGPFFGEFSYDAEACKKVAISYYSKNLKTSTRLYYHGGCTFKDYEKTTVLAHYEDLENHPAIIYSRYGKGQVLLSGVHFEYPIEHAGHPLEKRRKKILSNLLQILRHGT